MGEENNLQEVEDVVPTTHSNSTIQKKLEDLESKLQTVIERQIEDRQSVNSQFNEIRVQLLSISQQLDVLQASRSSKKKVKSQKVTGAAGESKKTQETLPSF